MKKIIVVVVSFFICGCATNVRKPVNFDQAISRVQTIAVMPPDIEVYKLTAGGMRELIDEWSDEAKTNTGAALKNQLASRYGYNVRFISEDWLKENFKELWKGNQALYNAVSYSIMQHTYPGADTFSDKVKNFDYTMGEETFDLALACGADALLFVRGVDHEATAGRMMLTFWNILMGAATGVYYIPLNPSAMDVALVDGNSGDVLWYKVTPGDTEYNFRDPRTIDGIIGWLVKDLLEKEK